MLKHEAVWAAIDRLAQEYGLSVSGLAKKAGLDPTTFNKSKRITAENKQRWPSTESVSKILAATGAPLSEFMGYLGQPNTNESRFSNIPVLGLAQAGDNGFFDDAGYPVGGSWDEISFPGIGDPHAYALEISGDSMDPVFRDGDVIIISPGVSIRRGDRVVVKTVEGEILAKQLVRQTAKRIELTSLNKDHDDRTFNVEEVDWIARVVWASQ